MIHVDAHADVNDEMFGEKIAHGTPFRRAVEEGLLTCDKVWQIGLRGSGYSPEDFDWPRQQGFTVIEAEQCWYKSLAPLMQEVRAKIGDHPTYLTYDIDSLDPAFAPGTGTVEVGGLSTWQALEIIRGCRGLNLVGGDLVEVSPPLDPAGKHGPDRRQLPVRNALRAARRDVWLRLHGRARGTFIHKGTNGRSRDRLTAADVEAYETGHWRNWCRLRPLARSGRFLCRLIGKAGPRAPVGAPPRRWP